MSARKNPSAGMRGGGGHPCKHCGEASRDHMLAMTEQRCRDGSGKRFEPLLTLVAAARRLDSFDDEEVAAMLQLFEMLQRKADVSIAIKRGAIVSVMRKFQSMRERAGT